MGRGRRRAGLMVTALVGAISACSSIVGFGDDVRLGADASVEAGAGGAAGAAAGAGGAGAGGVAGGSPGGASGAGGADASAGAAGALAGAGGAAGAGGVAGSSGADAGTDADAGCSLGLAGAAGAAGGSGGLLFFQDFEHTGGGDCANEMPPMADLVGAAPANCDHDSAPRGSQSAHIFRSEALACPGCLGAPRSKIWVELSYFLMDEFATEWVLFAPVRGGEPLRNARTGAEAIIDSSGRIVLRCVDDPSKADVGAFHSGYPYSLTFHYDWETHSAAVYRRLLLNGYPSGQRGEPLEVQCGCGPAPDGFYSEGVSNGIEGNGLIDDIRVAVELSDIDDSI